MAKGEDGQLDNQWEIPHAFPHNMKKQMHLLMCHEDAMIG